MKIPALILLTGMALAAGTSGSALADSDRGHDKGGARHHQVERHHVRHDYDRGRDYKYGHRYDRGHDRGYGHKYGHRHGNPRWYAPPHRYWAHDRRYYRPHYRPAPSYSDSWYGVHLFFGGH